MKNIKLLLLLFLLLIPAAASAQSGISVLKDQAVGEFPDRISFNLEIEDTLEVADIKLIYRVDAHTCQESYARQAVAYDLGDPITAEWTWELRRSGTLPPGTVILWQWEVTDTTGNVFQTDQQSFIVHDQRHTWLSVSQDDITVLWYEGNAAFGAEMLDVAVDSIERLTDEMGLLMEDPINITIYPSAEEVQGILFFTTGWEGGVAFPNYGGTVMGIAPGDSYAYSVIPHELTHLLIGTMITNCYGTFLPTWLNEGLAEFGEEAITAGSEAQIREALEEGTLPTLKSLEGGFSAFGDEAILAYQQGGAVTNYLIATYGSDKMTDLILTVKGGLDIDDALEEVYGFDTNGLEQEWRNSLGFDFTYVTDTESTGSGATENATPIPTIALVDPFGGSTPVPVAATQTAPAATEAPEVSSALEDPISDLPAEVEPAPSFLEKYGVYLLVGVGCIGLVAVIAILGFVFRRKTK